jgi:hypothetical protein
MFIEHKAYLFTSKFGTIRPCRWHICAIVLCWIAVSIMRQTPMPYQYLVEEIRWSRLNQPVSVGID